MKYSKIFNHQTQRLVVQIVPLTAKVYYIIICSNLNYPLEPFMPKQISTNLTNSKAPQPKKSIQSSTNNLFQAQKVTELLEDFCRSTSKYQNLYMQIADDHASLTPKLSITQGVEEFLLDPKLVQESYINKLFINLRSSTSYLKLLTNQPKLAEKIKKSIKKQKRVFKKTFRFEDRLQQLSKTQSRRAKELAYLFDSVSELIASYQTSLQTQQSSKSESFKDFIGSSESCVKQLRTTLEECRMKNLFLQNEIIYTKLKQKEGLKHSLLNLQESYQQSGSPQDIRRAQELAFIQIALQANIKPSENNILPNPTNKAEPLQSIEAVHDAEKPSNELMSSSIKVEQEQQEIQDLKQCPQQLFYQIPQFMIPQMAFYIFPPHLMYLNMIPAYTQIMMPQLVPQLQAIYPYGNIDNPSMIEG